VIFQVDDMLTKDVAELMKLIQKEDAGFTGRKSFSVIQGLHLACTGYNSSVAVLLSSKSILLNHATGCS